MHDGRKVTKGTNRTEQKRLFKKMSSKSKCEQIKLVKYAKEAIQCRIFFVFEVDA